MSIEQLQKRHGIANAKVGNKVMGNIRRANIGYHTHSSVCLGLLAVLLLASKAGSAGETPQLAVQSDSASSFVIQASGTLYVWGDNSEGQLGLGNTNNQALPVPVTFPAGVNRWRAIASGGDAHTLALGDNGEIYSCGYNAGGQLGLDDPNVRVPNFTLVRRPLGVDAWMAIAAGGGASFALTTNGQLYAWGFNGFGQLGLGDNNNRPLPTLVPLPSGVSAWQAMAAGAHHTVALTSDGRLFATGLNDSGQLGDNTYTSRQKFELVPLPSGVTQWVSTACSVDSSFAITSTGRLYAWGGDAGGELGIGFIIGGPRYGTNQPCLVALPSGVTGWKGVSGGPYHTLGFGNDNQIYAWGNNYNVPLGTGSTNMLVLSPAAVLEWPFVTNWMAVTAGREHALAVGDDCRLYVWGLNSYNELGPVGASTRPEPVYVLGDLCSTNPLPIVTIRATVPIATEAPSTNGSTNIGAFELSRTGNTDSTFGTFVSFSGTAIRGVDYYTVPWLDDDTTLIIPAGQKSTTVLVIPVDDNRAGPDKTVSVAVQPSNYTPFTIGNPSSATVTILEDNDTNRPPSVWLTFPPANARFASGNNIMLAADTFDPDLNAKIVQYFVDGDLVGTTSLNSITNINDYLRTNFTQFTSVLVDEVAPGSHVVTCRVTDQFGAQATASGSFTVLPAGSPPGTPRLDPASSSISAYALDNYGALYIWGAVLNNEFGTNGAWHQSLPIQVPLPERASAWLQISGSEAGPYWLAIANNGQLYSWGDNGYGELGIGFAAGPQISPVLVPPPAGVSGWRKVAAASGYVLAIANTGALYGWGNDAYRQLGIGPYVNPDRPVHVPFPPGVTNWIDVAAGTLHSLALADNGALYACGDNGAGQMGNNSVPGASYFIPVLLPPNVSRWSKVASGGYHSLAFGDDGNLYGWGDNSYGEIQPSSPMRKVTTPVIVAPVTAPWVTAAATSAGTLALAADGNLFFSTSESYRLLPVPAGATRWMSMAGGVDYGLAIADDCRLYAWGNNSRGALGNGSLTNSQVPVAARLAANFCPAPTVLPVIRTFPRFQVSPADFSFTMVSVNYSNAVAILDATLSTNSAGVPMQFSWFKAGVTNPFATTMVAKALLGLGTNNIELHVSALNRVAITNAGVRIITTGQAVAELEQSVEQSDLGDRQLFTLLLDPLRSAHQAFDGGEPQAGLVHLRIFKTRISDHLASIAPVLANNFSQAAQELIDLFQPQSPGHTLVQVARSTKGQSLQFSGNPGQTYLIEAGTNLNDWHIIGIASEQTRGSFEFKDSSLGISPTRFYRIVLP